MTNAEALTVRADWERAFKDIGREVGPRSPLYELLGPLAWGRYEYEQAAQGTTGGARVHNAVGYLVGMRNALVRACRMMNLDTEERLLLDMYRRIDGYALARRKMNA